MLDRPSSTPSSVASYSVPPVVRAIKLLRHIAAGHSIANHSQAARALGINRTTLLRLLRTLEAEGFIERVAGTDNFELGNGLIELAGQKISSLDVTQVANPILAELAAGIGLSCHLGVLDGREVLYVLRATPNVHLVSNVRIGTRLPAHASTMGRAILAFMSEGEVTGLFNGKSLFAVTDKTATTMKALRRQLDETRVSGIADSRSNFEIGIDSVAAPVFDHSGRVAAAINASGPEQAFNSPKDRRSAIAGAVRDAAAEISKRLGHVGAMPGRGELDVPAAGRSKSAPKR